MASNLDFIKDEFNDIYNLAVIAEKNVHTEPRTSAIYSRMTLEATVKWLYANDPYMKQPYKTKAGLGAYLYNSYFKDTFTTKEFRLCEITKLIGDKAVHTSKTISAKDAFSAFNSLFNFVKCVNHYYGETSRKDAEFDENLIPKESPEQISKSQIEKEKKALENKYNQLLEELKSKSTDEINQLKNKVRILKEENSINPFEAKLDKSEAETRKLYIDLLLEEAGWDLSKPNVKEFKIKGMPNKSNEGYADYVLWDDGGKPLAVVEAKKTMRSPEEGQQQAKLYADCLEKEYNVRPVIFLTNGYEVFLWDDSEYPKRQVHGFYTAKDLTRLIHRRIIKKKINKYTIDERITNRYYQERAVKKVVERFHDKHRKSLLVMATGSGKTRTAISIVKVLTELNWVQRILFLADRTLLVGQAMRNFNLHLPNVSMVNLLEEKETEQSRMVFSTYMTMMNKLENVEEGNNREFGIGHFDLVIIDESHRSIYKKYGAVFEYFDSMLLGLTATPIIGDDRDTYRVFGMEANQPTDYYDLEKAVDDKYLVPPRLLDVDLKFPTQGIKYEDLTEAEKEEYEEKFSDEEGWLPKEIAPNAVNNWLYNTDTVDKMFEILFDKGIKVESGDKLGKTIIFAKNHNHAKFIEERFDTLYPHLKGHFARVIDNKTEYVKSLVEDFENPKKYPQIAISVDMLDTGIDIPEVVNLVFIKTVRSYAKFWQMIGRGTRLCENLFGVGDHKTHFNIFDFCGNFKFFDTFPKGTVSSAQQSMSQKIFNRRVDISKLLQSSEYQDNENIKLREQTITVLRNEIETLDSSGIMVRKEKKYVDKYSLEELWTDITDVKVKELNEHISGLPFKSTEEDEFARRFDLLMLNLEYFILEKSTKQESYIKKVIIIAKELSKKANIPTISTKLDIINEVQKQEFWQDASIGTIDQIRIALRDLIKFLDKEGNAQGIVYTSFSDNIDGIEEKDVILKNHDMDDYKDRVRNYIREHLDNLAVKKIKHKIKLDSNDLIELEKLIFNEDTGSRDDFVTNFGEQPLTEFVRRLVGLDKEVVTRQFSKFSNEGNLNPLQIEFINEIIENLTQNGILEIEKLGEQPFSEIGGGIMDVFDDASYKIVKIIEELNKI